MMQKILTDKEYEYFVVSVRAFVNEVCERFHLSEDEAVEKIRRELKLR